jgi:hypothetical protein
MIVEDIWKTQTIIAADIEHFRNCSWKGTDEEGARRTSSIQSRSISDISAESESCQAEVEHTGCLLRMRPKYWTQLLPNFSFMGNLSGLRRSGSEQRILNQWFSKIMFVQQGLFATRVKTAIAEWIWEHGMESAWATAEKARQLRRCEYRGTESDLMSIRISPRRKHDAGYIQCSKLRDREVDDRLWKARNYTVFMCSIFSRLHKRGIQKLGGSSWARDRQQCRKRRAKRSLKGVKHRRCREDEKTKDIWRNSTAEEPFA